MAGPVLPNLEPLIAMGINPKTGLPYKFGGTKCTLKEDIKIALRIIDEQDATNRYRWSNIEFLKLTSQELERMIYYKGQLSFFYLKDLDQYFITPYALDGTVDLYGRYNSIHPVAPYACETDDKNGKAQTQYLSQIKLNCVYEVPEEINEDTKINSAVLVHDYTKQISQTIIPRVTVNEPILDTMSEFIPYMRTNALLSTGVKGVRVNDADQQENVLEASKSIESCALTGKGFLPIVGSIEFQELGNGNVGNSEKFMMDMQSIDNFRLSTYGIDNGGLFEKQSHILQSEADINGGPVGLVLDDGLKIRQHFCDIVNAIWGKNISVEVNPGLKQVKKEQPLDDNYHEKDTEGEFEDDSTI